MRIRSYLLLFVFLVPTLFYGFGTEKDSLIVDKTVPPALIAEAPAAFVQLPGLDEKFPLATTIDIKAAPEFSDIQLLEEYKPLADTIIKFKDAAKASFDEIATNNSWVTTFTNTDIQTLPVGIKKEMNGIEYQVGFTQARFYENYTEFTVFARIILPQTDKNGLPRELFFGANNVKLSQQGGIVGDATLALLGDMHIPFNGGSWLLTLNGGFDFKTGNTQNKTYVTIGCDGFKELGIQGEVQFSRKMILPVDDKGEVQKSETRPYKRYDGKTISIPNRVRGSFNVVASDWNDLLVELSITPFVLAEHPDKFVFGINNATFDFSDLRNGNVVFPNYYHEKGLLLPNENAWRGVYVQSLKIGLPAVFKTEESIKKKERVHFTAANLLIDGNGVSGIFNIEKTIIPLEEGRTSESKAWQISVNNIGVTIAANKLMGAEFGGQIVLPISKVEQRDASGKQINEKTLGLGYKGIISEQEYGLVVSTINTLRFDVFKAKAELAPNSAIELLVRDNNFRPKAILNGRLAISASQKDSLENEGQTYTDDEGDTKEIQFTGIRFENLILQTESPYIQADYFGYEDRVSIANFPVSIANIAFTANDYEAGLEFDLALNLMGEKDKGFAGEARLGIIGKFSEEGKRQRWKFDRVTLSKINIEVNLGAMKLKGGLLLMVDDPEYGDGFMAEIEGTFGSFGPISCKAIFGKKDFRYWYVDGAVHGLTIQVGPIQISGFAGGAYYRMTRRKGVGAKFSPSGLSYVPNEDTGLGVKAMVFGGIGSAEAISIGLGFEIEFNRSMGVNRIGFFGEAKVMATIDIPNPLGELTDQLADSVGDAVGDALTGAVGEKLANAATKTLMDKAENEYTGDLGGEGMISAYLAMEFDFVNKSFHAELKIFINVMGVLVGRGEENMAGGGVVHISPDEWYVRMGTPTNRLGLKMGIGSFIMETGGYFMMGDGIPSSPPPPPIVAEILGVDAEVLDYMRDENALGEGKGFTFGADFSLDTGDIAFLMFYGRFMVGAGFDLMLKDYGTASCSNTGEVVGIDGWYANGQSYAYLQGEMGIRIKLFSIKKRISIMKGSTAILMQAKGPNPFWFRGYATGEFDVLGGLVSGSFRFKVKMGEECEFENQDPLGGIKIIADVSPADASNDVDVFAAPQASFSFKVDEEFIIPEDSGDRHYKIILEQFNVVDEAGKEIVGELEWNYTKDRGTFISDDILPPNTKLKATVQVSFQEKINGVFQTIKVDGEKAIEREERNFTTGTAPNVIPIHNISYAYPVISQDYVYPKEYPKGYIQLRRGQDYLFDSQQWQSSVQYTDSNENILPTAFSYDTATNKVNYVLPKIKNETAYIMQIISSPKTSGKSQNSDITETQEFEAGNTVNLTVKQSEDVLRDGDIERLTYDFKTSSHNTFAAKIKAISVTAHNIGKVNTDVIYLFSTTKPYEGFDIPELVGTKHTGNIPLIAIEATLEDRYFTEDIQPAVYAGYPFNGAYTITNRKVEEWGVPPRRAIPIEGSYLENVKNKVNQTQVQTRFPFWYNLPRIYKEDFINLRDQVYLDYVYGHINDTHPAMALTRAKYKFIRGGKYKTRMQYTLPGGIKGSQAVYTFKNTLEYR